MSDFITPRDAWYQIGRGYGASVRIMIIEQAERIKMPISALSRSGQMVFAGQIGDDLAKVLTTLEVE